jgi:hypothetical protein
MTEEEWECNCIYAMEIKLLENTYLKLDADGENIQ